MIQTLSNYRIALLGAGKLGTCILQGLLKQGISIDRLIATTASEDSAQALASKLGIQAVTDNREAAHQADVVIVAVKPSGVAGLLEEIKPVIEQSHALIISVAAGVSSDSITDVVGHHVPVICAMPNTASSVGQSATGAFANAYVSEKQHNLAHALLLSLGQVFWLPKEDLLTAVVGIAGSAPAYFFLVMEGLIQAGQSMGLDYDTALRLVAQTCYGAGALVQQSQLTPDQLRGQVTSPNGSTAKALECLRNEDLVGMMERAAQAAAQHAARLDADQLSSNEQAKE